MNAYYFLNARIRNQQMEGITGTNGDVPGNRNGILEGFLLYEQTVN